MFRLGSDRARGLQLRWSADASTTRTRCTKASASLGRADKGALGWILTRSACAQTRQTTDDFAGRDLNARRADDRRSLHAFSSNALRAGRTLSSVHTKNAFPSTRRAQGRQPVRSSYQVVLNVCPACTAGRQAGNGQLVPVSKEAVEMAQCDAQRVRSEPREGHAHVDKHAKQDIPTSSASRRAAARRAPLPRPRVQERGLSRY
jgi:hypothetical protein